MTDAEMLAEALRDTLKCLAFVEEMIIPDVDARRWAFQTLHGEPAQVLAAYESRKAVREALKNAPIDDEPYTDEQRAAVEKAREYDTCPTCGIQGPMRICKPGNCPDCGAPPKPLCVEEARQVQQMNSLFPTRINRGRSMTAEERKEHQAILDQRSKPICPTCGGVGTEWDGYSAYVTPCPDCRGEK